jgi:hypothetical protein
MAAHEGLMPAYQVFFVGAALLGIPAIVLFMALAAQQRAPGPATSNA